MTETLPLRAILESLKEPVVFVDAAHIIRYMNAAGASHYAKWGGRELVDRSIMDCHNPESGEKIRAIFAEMQQTDIDEKLYAKNAERRIYMRAVRSPEGDLLGYYERYEYLQGEDHE
jgi:DUF438 domain-containing protein